LVNRHAEVAEYVGRGANFLIDVRLRVWMAESFRDEGNTHARRTPVESFLVGVRPWCVLSRVQAVCPGDNLKQECIIGDSGSHWTGMVDRHVHGHDAGIRDQAEARFHTAYSAERRRHANRTSLIASDGHVDLFAGNEGCRTGGGTTR